MSKCPFTFEELSEFNSESKTTRWENVYLLLIDHLIDWSVNKELSNYKDPADEWFDNKDQVWIDVENSKGNLLIVQTRDDWRATWDESFVSGKIVKVVFECRDRNKNNEPFQLPDCFGKTTDKILRNTHD